MNIFMLYCCVYLSCFLTTIAVAKEHVIGQKDSIFSQTNSSIKVGDSVNVWNDEEKFHNVFSLSDTATFDLGSYPQGESRKVVFDNIGIVEVECAIHPTMLMTVEVKE